MPRGLRSTGVCIFARARCAYHFSPPRLGPMIGDDRGSAMKTVILAGGLGTRLSEETVLRPKPMVEIGGHPILWHILNIYAAHGHKDFVIACGYKAEIIKEYFCNYFLYDGDIEVDL